MTKKIDKVTYLVDLIILTFVRVYIELKFYFIFACFFLPFMFKQNLKIFRLSPSNGLIYFFGDRKSEIIIKKQSNYMSEG